MNFNLGQFQKTQNGLLIFGLFYCETKSNKIFHSHSYIGFLRISEDVQLRRKPIELGQNVFLSENQQTVLIFLKLT